MQLTSILPGSTCERMRVMPMVERGATRVNFNDVNRQQPTSRAALLADGHSRGVNAQSCRVHGGAALQAAATIAAREAEALAACNVRSPLRAIDPSATMPEWLRR